METKRQAYIGISQRPQIGVKVRQGLILTYTFRTVHLHSAVDHFERHTRDGELDSQG